MADTTGGRIALAPHDGHRTLEAWTYQRLREAIARGTLAPGAKLVGSRLATEMGVSRITIANALKRLASEGFVVVTPHKEAVVAALDETSLAEIFAVRYALDALAMRAAAAHATPGMLAPLRTVDRLLPAAADRDDIEAYRRLEREFHHGIYALAELPLVTAILTDLWDRLEPYRGRRYTQQGLAFATHDEHPHILDTLAAHDGDAAVAAMHAHVSAGYDRYVQVIRTPLLDNAPMTP